MSSIPTGTVTFLFTDIEGSTKLAQDFPIAMPAMLARHHAILHQTAGSHNGYVFQIRGDAFCVAFHSAPDAVKAALDAQRALVCEPWSTAPIKVRMGIHTGAAQAGAIEELAGEYVGYLTLTRVQRVMSLAHGGQILLSNATAELLWGELPDQVSLRDMGEHRLKGLINLDHLWQPLAPDLPSDFPPLQSINTIPNNLPVQLTNFFGREKEIAEVKQTLEKHRLVTLTGSGGAGKSRLSLQVAAVLLDQFPSGIWFVELAPLTEPDLIPQTILTAIGIQTQQGLTAQEVLIDFLREKDCLLILDNCEHLLEASARLVDTLLKTAPSLKILASSREALGVNGEQAWRVPSLSVPDMKHLPPLEQLLQYESIRLFIDRAYLVQPHFVITKENAPAVAKICQRLDGIPLALELAAARLRALSVDQIAVRLDDRFRLLTGGSRTALPRQQTLRAMIDWSYNLLSEQEKMLLRRLAVFAGGWTLEAAEAICSSNGIEPEDILDLLDHLVDKSLIINVNDEIRYRRLETIRQYAREKLSESDEGATYRNRHLAYFLRWVEEIEPGLRGPQQVELLDRLENDIDNLRAALEWSRESDPESGLQLASMLKWFWHLCSLFEEGIDRLEDVLDSSKKSGTEIEPLFMARSLSVLAWSSLWGGNMQTATISLKESFELCEKIPGQVSELITADNLFLSAALALNRGDLSQTKMFNEKSLRIYEKWGNKFGIAEVSTTLAGSAMYSEDFVSASHWAEAGIAIRKELGDKDGLAFALTIGALVPLAQGDYARSKQLLAAALEACKETRFEASLGVALGYLALIYWLEDDLVQALDYLLRLITLAHEKNYSRLKTFCLYYLALFFFKQKLYCTSIKINGAAEASKTPYREFFYVPPAVNQTFQQYLLEAREVLGETDFNAAHDEGRAMTLDQAISYALKELGF